MAISLCASRVDELQGPMRRWESQVVAALAELRRPLSHLFASRERLEAGQAAHAAALAECSAATDSLEQHAERQASAARAVAGTDRLLAIAGQSVSQCVHEVHDALERCKARHGQQAHAIQLLRSDWLAQTSASLATAAGVLAAARPPIALRLSHAHDTGSAELPIALVPVLADQHECELAMLHGEEALVSAALALADALGAYCESTAELSSDHHTHSAASLWTDLLSSVVADPTCTTACLARVETLHSDALNERFNSDLVAYLTKLKREDDSLGVQQAALENERTVLEGASAAAEQDEARSAVLQLKELVSTCPPAALREALRRALRGALHQLQAMGEAALQPAAEAGVAVSTRISDTGECESALERCGELVPALFEALEALRLWDRYLPAQTDQHNDSVGKEARRAASSLLSCCVEATVQIQQLVLDFNSLLLPETIKAVQATDASVHSAFDELEAIHVALCNWQAQRLAHGQRVAAQATFEASYDDTWQQAAWTLSTIEAEARAVGQGDELCWEEAGELGDRYETAKDRVTKLSQAWADRASTARAFVEESDRLECELAQIRARYDTLVTVTDARQGGRVLISGFHHLWQPLESSHLMCGELISQLAPLAAGHTGSKVGGIDNVAPSHDATAVFVAKIATMRKVFAASCSAPRASISVPTVGGAGAQFAGAAAADLTGSLAALVCSELVNLVNFTLLPAALVSLEACAAVDSGALNSLLDEHAAPDLCATIGSCCAASVARALRPRRLAALAASLTRIGQQRARRKALRWQAAWLYADLLSPAVATANGCGHRAAALQGLQRALSAAVSAQSERDEAGKRHSELCQRRIIPGLTRARAPQGGRGTVAADAATRQTGGRLLHDLQLAIEEAEARADDTRTKVRQLCAVGEAVLGLESSRGWGRGRVGKSLRKANGEVLQRLRAEQEAQVKLLVQRQQEEQVVVSLRTSAALDEEAAALLARKAASQGSLVREYVSECTAVGAQVQTAADKLGRLFTDSLAMAEDATALAEQLAKLNLDQRALEEIQHVVALLHTSWRELHDSATIISSVVLPHLLQFRSTRTHICSLITSLSGSEGDINTFVQQVETQSQAPYPLLLQLGTAVSAAAAAAVAQSGAGGAEDGSDDEAGAADDGLAAADEAAGGGGGGGALVAEQGTIEHVPPVDSALSTRRAFRQHKNTHALTVLRRIKCKLDGKDRWPGKERDTKHSIVEQVDSVIKQACSQDNLCLLFEGWSAWV